MNRYIFNFIIAFILLVTINSLYSAQSCDSTKGETHRETYSSGILGQAMFYSVYLPPCYDETADNYPVIYLMHGSNENDEHWLRLGLHDELDIRIANGEVPPLVVIMPFGNVIANRNRFDRISWGNIFLEELIPSAESNFNIATDKKQRVIGGISRGGFWAYQIAFSHPELFSAVGGHSAFFDLYHAEPEVNPLHLATSQPDIESMRLWLDRGQFDFAADGLDIMGERLSERGLDYTYLVYPTGEHNSLYWSQHVNEYIDFYVADWLVPQQTPTQSTAPNPFVTNTPSVFVPTSTPQLQPESTDDISLFFPAVGFPSLQTSIATVDLQAVLEGQFDSQLILDTQTLANLQALNIPIHPDTQIVSENDLRSALWQNREAYTLLPITSLRLDYRVLFVDDEPLMDTLETYPFALPSDNPNFELAKLTRITASGVTAPARQTLTAFDSHDLEWATSGIQSYVTSSDIFHMSNEVSAVAHCPSLSGEVLGGATSLCTKPEYLELFTLLDVDILELSGNHNNDYGYQAYTDTLTFYRENEITTVGGGQTLDEAQSPVIINHNGNSIGWIACNVPGPYYAIVNEVPNNLGGVRPGAALCDWNWLEREIPNVANQVDTLIISVQSEEIEDYLPTTDQKNDFRKLVDLGADIVLGTANHKPQTYEFYHDGFIHYGMGNLYFDQPFWGNMRFFMNTFYVYDGSVQGVEIFPGLIEDLGRPRLMTPEERDNFLFFMLREQNGF